MEIVLFLIFILIGSIGASISSIVFWAINKWIINNLLSESIFRILLNLLMIGIPAFLGSMLALILIIGFAADENAGEIFPYYIGVSIGISFISMGIYYYVMIR